MTNSNHRREPLGLIAFAMATNTHLQPGLWRTRSDQNPNWYGETQSWIELAKLLDGAGFDALFFADVIGLYGEYAGSHEIFARHGHQIPTLDPSGLIPLLANATQNLGFIITSSILQEHPFTFARKLSSLDQWTNGRVGWNIVTGHNANGYRNFGYDDLVPHADRYNWAEEYLDVVYKLWEGSWDEDALMNDPRSGKFADASKIHRINHVGERYKVEGPHLVAPTRQRTPLLAQAGSSDRGQDFAAKHAEIVLFAAPNPEAALRQVESTTERLRSTGRGVDEAKYFQTLSFIIGSTEAEARRLEAELDEHLDSDGAVAHFGGSIGIDLGLIGLDTPIEAIKTEAVKSNLASLLKETDGRKPTVRDVIALRKRSRIVGTPEQIADRILDWQNAGISGIAVTNSLIPDSYAAFIDHVLPTLRERGLVRHLDHRSGQTLRGRVFGRDRLLQGHPAAAQRGAFAEQSIGGLHA